MPCNIRFYHDGQPDAWDKLSDTGKANHESSLTSDEMKVLVMRILDIPGMDAPPADMPEKISDLATTLASDAGEVIVKKGIHQRDTDVHFTLNIYPEAGGAYHIWLKAGEDVCIPSAPAPSGKVAKVMLFRYQPTGITHVQGNITVKWPAAFVCSAGNMPLGRPRGKSISVGNVGVVMATPPTGAQRVEGLTNAPPQGWQPPTQ